MTRTTKIFLFLGFFSLGYGVVYMFTVAGCTPSISPFTAIFNFYTGVGLLLLCPVTLFYGARFYREKRTDLTLFFIGWCLASFLAVIFPVFNIFLIAPECELSGTIDVSNPPPFTVPGQGLVGSTSTSSVQ